MQRLFRLFTRTHTIGHQEMVGNQESSTARNFEMHPLVHSSTAAASIIGDISGDTQIGHSSG